MTENEAKQVLENIWDFATAEDDYFGDFVEKAIDIANNIFEEIQQYRAIGTVEDIEKSMQNVSVLLAEHELLKLYQSIGTVEECRAAVEKMKPKKAIREKGIPYCPCCGAVATTDTGDSFLDYEVTHCDNCGQAIGEGE